MIFIDANNPPKDGATFILHVCDKNVAMFRVSGDGRCSDMVTGTVESCLIDALRARYPNVAVILNESDRAGPRTKFAFKRWSDFCAAYNNTVTCKSKVIAEFVWLCTKMADGLCEVGAGGALCPTIRGAKADSEEVDGESEEVREKEND